MTLGRSLTGSLSGSFTSYARMDEPQKDEAHVCEVAAHEAAPTALSKTNREVDVRQARGLLLGAAIAIAGCLCAAVLAATLFVLALAIQERKETSGVETGLGDD